MGLDKVPDEMMACEVIEFNKPYKIHKVKTPKDLGPHDLLVKVAVASLCHTDFMVAEGIMGTKLPCVASHEGTGTIAAVGSEVKKFQEGDRVMCGLFKNQCGVCSDCQNPSDNYKQYCTASDGAIGVHIDGAFADYVVCDSRNTAKLPDKVSFETAAPLACAGSTAYRGIVQAKLKAGEWICIVGSGGGLGHLAIQFAKAKGLQVIAIDARDGGLELSKHHGADVIVDARKGNKSVVEEVHKVTNNQGADATVVLSDADSAAATACAATKIHGLLVQIAQPEQVKIPFAELIFRDIRIQGSLICSPSESSEMLTTVAENDITVKTNPFKGLNSIPELVKFAESGKMTGKGIIIVDEEQTKAEQKPGLKLV